MTCFGLSQLGGFQCVLYFGVVKGLLLNIFPKISGIIKYRISHKAPDFIVFFREIGAAYCLRFCSSVPS